MKKILIWFVVLGLATLFCGCAGMVRWSTREELGRPGLSSLQESSATIYDWEESRFKVVGKNMFTDNVPGEIPADAIEYALIDFAKIDDTYLDRIINATQKSLREWGYANIYYDDGKKNVCSVQLINHKKSKHLEVLVSRGIKPKVFSIDMSDYHKSTR